MKAKLLGRPAGRDGMRRGAERRTFRSGWSVLSVAALLCVTAVDSFANLLHYIPLNNDPVWSPKIVDHVEDPDIFLDEWIILSGLSDEDYFARDATLVQYIRPELVPLSDTTAIFDAPTRERSDNARATAYYEFEVSVLAARNDTSVEIGLTDLINFVRWSESQQTVRSDIDDVTVVYNMPRWSTISDLPLRLRIYYHFVDHVVTFVIVDGEGAESTPVSWQSSGVNPFVNHHDSGLGGTDPDHLDVYPFLSCQVDCTLTATDWDLLDCDTSGGDVDVESCVRLGVVGNGIVDPGERCDDGNTVNGDGCDANGQFETAGRRCQEAVALAGDKYVRSTLKALRGCRNRLNQGKALFEDSQGSVPLVDSLRCPVQFEASTKIAKAGAKLRKLLTARCTDETVGALQACGATLAELVSEDGTAGCLIETHGAAVDFLLMAQYGE